MFASSFSEYSINLGALTCLSRNDPDKDIFKIVKKPQKKRRRNFYNLVDIKDGWLVCQSETYSLDNICVGGKQESKLCTLKNTNNEVVDLGYLR